MIPGGETGERGGRESSEDSQAIDQTVEMREVIGQLPERHLQLYTLLSTIDQELASAGIAAIVSDIDLQAFLEENQQPYAFDANNNPIYKQLDGHLVLGGDYFEHLIINRLEDSTSVESIICSLTGDDQDYEALKLSFTIDLLYRSNITTRSRHAQARLEPVINYRTARYADGSDPNIPAGSIVVDFVWEAFDGVVNPPLDKLFDIGRLYYVDVKRPAYSHELAAHLLQEISDNKISTVWFAGLRDKDEIARRLEDGSEGPIIYVEEEGNCMVYWPLSVYKIGEGVAEGSAKPIDLKALNSLSGLDLSNRTTLDKHLNLRDIEDWEKFVCPEDMVLIAESEVLIDPGEYVMILMTVDQFGNVEQRHLLSTVFDSGKENRKPRFEIRLKKGEKLPKWMAIVYYRAVPAIEPPFPLPIVTDD